MDESKGGSPREGGKEQLGRKQASSPAKLARDRAVLLLLARLCAFGLEEGEREGG